MYFIDYFVSVVSELSSIIITTKRSYRVECFTYFFIFIFKRIQPKYTYINDGKISVGMRVEEWNVWTRLNRNSPSKTAVQNYSKNYTKSIRPAEYRIKNDIKTEDKIIRFYFRTLRSRMSRAPLLPKYLHVVSFWPELYGKIGVSLELFSLV